MPRSERRGGRCRGGGILSQLTSSDSSRKLVVAGQSIYIVQTIACCDVQTASHCGCARIVTLFFSCVEWLKALKSESEKTER